MTETNNFDEFCTLLCASKCLKCSKQYLHKLIKKNRIVGCFKKGGMWFLPCAEVCKISIKRVKNEQN